MTGNIDLANIKIRCIPDNPHAISGVLNTKKVRFNIETGNEGEMTKRTPLNLVLVLDRSGSMESDNKLTFAKKAVISVLNLLHDDDIVHLVAYDADVSIIFENARVHSRQYLYPLVDKIESSGSTNMSTAIDTGAGLLDKYLYDGFSRCMFLFSDGQANVGMKTCAELTNLVAGYHSKGIADYFLSSPDKIELVVTKALVCVFGVCASRVRLIVRGKNGTIVTKIWGHGDIVAGASLGDLHLNNLQSVLCEFTTASTTNNEIETLAYELQYNQPNDLNGAPIVIKNTLSLKFVEDELLIADLDPHVKTMLTTQMVSEMDKKIAQLVNDNRIKEAIKLVDDQIALLKDAERFDDERGMISLLLRLAEHMQKKLKSENVDRKIVAKGYEHHAFLKEDCDDEDMGFGLFD